MFDQELNLSELELPEDANADMRDIRLGADGIIYGTTNFGDLMVKPGSRMKEQRTVSI